MLDDAVYELKDPCAYRFDAVSLNLLMDYGLQHGLTEADCLMGTGLTPSMMDCPESEVAPDQELRVIDNLVRALDEPYWHGFSLGLRYDLTVYGVWGLGLMTSTGPLEAIKRGAAYWGATPSLIRSRLMVSPSGPTLALDYSHLPAGVREFLVGRNLGSLYAIHQDLLPEHRIGICGVSLTLPRSKGMERTESLFQCSIQTNQPEAYLSLDPAILSLAFSKANPVVASQCDRHCEREMERRRLHAPVADQVKQYLQDRPFPPPSLQEVAYALRMSDRSLRRALEVEGTNWRNLLMQVLVSHAQKRLRSPRISVQQVADELGYADPSSFSHAFKRWTGVSPVQFRRAARPLGT